jgi:glucuronokinase
MGWHLVLATESAASTATGRLAQAPPHLLSTDSVGSVADGIAHMTGSSRLDRVLTASHVSASEVIVAVAARHFAWFAQWASARGVPQVALLNTGASSPDHSDQLDAAQVLEAAVRHATGPMGVASSDLFPLSVHVALAPATASTAPHVLKSESDVAVVAVAVAADLASARRQVSSSETDAGRTSRVDVEKWAAAVEAADPACRAAYSFARVGLMGNPSDQLHGKSMAVTVDNFCARVVVRPASCVFIEPHPVADQTFYGSLADLDSTVGRNGYSGGMRLVLAALRRFLILCREENLATDGQLRRGFALSYDTNVPRQVGLAGSSCIVSAIFKALARFFGVTLNYGTAPSAILAAEWQELGIHAGLMDRVSQLWGGLVSMDFNRQELEACGGHGRYTRLPLSQLPPLYLAYAMDPSDSGKIHSNVKERYFRGDEEVVAASRRWAGFVDAATDALASGNAAEFGALVNQNFDLRRQLYGDACLGMKNLHMIEIARRHNAAAKFPGSGGAILVVPMAGRTSDDDLAAMQRELQSHGYVLIRLRPVE